MRQEPQLYIVTIGPASYYVTTRGESALRAGLQSAGLRADDVRSAGAQAERTGSTLFIPGTLRPVPHGAFGLRAALEAGEACPI